MNKSLQLVEPPPLSGSAIEEEIDLREYWRTLKQGRWSILGLMFLAAVASLVIVYSMDPVYRATTTLMIEVESAKVVSIEDVYVGGSGNREYLTTQFGILESRNLVADVARRLQLDTHPLYDPDQQSESWLARVDLKSLVPAGLVPENYKDQAAPSENQRMSLLIDQVSEGLIVAPVRNSQLVNLTFESKDAELAATLPNTLARAYIEADLAARMNLAQDASRWLSAQMEQLRQKLEESEKALREFIQTQPITAFESLPEVLEHKTIQALKDQEAESLKLIAALDKRYGPEHPKMIAAREELAATRTTLQAELKKVVQSIGDRYDIDGNGVDTAGGRGGAGLSSELRRLEREVASNRELYNVFLDRIKETNLMGDVQSARARITDPAITPIEPAKPRKKLVVLLSVLAAMLIGVMLAFLRQRLDDTFKSVEEIESKLALPVVGLLPALKPDANSELGPARAILDPESADYAEGIRTVRTAVLMANVDDPRKTVLITSSMPREGKTTLACNLALAFGQTQQKVLLIDADMRRPSIDTVFGLDERKIGLSDYFTGSRPLKDCIVPMAGLNIDVLPVGLRPPNPLELLTSSAFKNLFEPLNDSYDRIIVDSAPIVQVSDASVLSNLVDSVLYVVKPNSTARPLVEKGLTSLRRVNAPLDGIVVSQMKHKQWRYGYYGYDYKGVSPGEYGYSYAYAGHGKKAVNE